MRLLIIEDDRTIAENLYEYLESRGHQCDYADCLATASRLLDEQVFEAAVLDRNLPDGDGLALARRLQALDRGLLALARRSGARKTDGILRLGALEYDSAAKAVRFAGRALQLPPKALRLVAELLSQPNRVFSRRELEIAIWGHEQESNDNLRSVLYTLRRAVGEDAGIEVVNIHGIGYKLICR